MTESTQPNPLRIALYGGGFDPIHRAHLVLAQTAIDALKLDDLIFMPSGGQAHYKTESNIVSGAHRVAMIHHAIAKQSKMRVSDYEAKLNHFSYTINTLRHFRSLYPEGSEIFLLVGGDWKDKIPSWKDGETLIRDFKVAVFSRPGFEKTSTSTYDTLSIEMPLMKISSSDIRQRIRQSKPFNDLLPAPVYEYISEHHLYL